MKKILLPLLATTLFAVGCQYDDTALTEEINAIKEKVSALESKCSILNDNASSLQKSITALENLYTVKEVKEITGGYSIVFTNGKEITIKNGVDGKAGATGATGAQGPKGETGAQGPKGETGSAGKDGVTPQIGVKQDAGLWYWTVNGEWLTRDDGTKIPAEATAEAAVIPSFKVVGGYWYVKTGESDWQLIEGSKQEGSAITVTQDNENVYITADGSTITIPLAGFSFKAGTTLVHLEAGKSIELPYTLRGGDESCRWTVKGTGVNVERVPADAKSGILKITAPADMKENGLVSVSVVNNTTSQMCMQYIDVILDITFSLSSNKVSFAADEDLSAVVKLVCGGVWSASSDNPDFTVSPASGNGNADITITATPNTDSSPRTGYVSILVNDEIYNIEVYQAKAAPTHDFDGCEYKSVEFLELGSTSGQFNRLIVETNVDGDPHCYKLTCNVAGNAWINVLPVKGSVSPEVLTYEYKVSEGAKIGFRVYWSPGGVFNAANRGDFGNMTKTSYSEFRWDLRTSLSGFGWTGAKGDAMRIDLMNMKVGDVVYFKEIHYRAYRDGEPNVGF